MKPLRPLLLLALLLVQAPGLRAQEPVRVFAAASLTNVLKDIAAQWQARGHAPPSLAHAASSVLAKQIEAGAPADLYASADLKWMAYLAERGRLVAGSQVNLLGNELVLIAPQGQGFAAELKPGFDLAAAFEGKLCTGDTASVPAGIYARQGLEALGLWAALQGRIVGADDVRTALAFVERGECGAGIVYATDAAISRKVQVIARFPAQSHQPIVYPFALVLGARPGSAAFLDYLKTSPEAAALFRQHGFVLLPQP